VPFRDFLRVSVLLFAGAATVLAVVTIAGASRSADSLLVIVSVAWWGVAALVGLWLGRRMGTTPGIQRQLAAARTTSTLPEAEPGTVLIERLWPLALLSVASGAVGFFFPQVPGIACGYALLVALTWRRQSSAVAAIEDRDGVRFLVERSSPFGPPQLLRTPWLRKMDPPAYAEDEDRAPAPL
jgi:hypothetical protein